MKLGVPANCIEPFPKSAYKRTNMLERVSVTYFEASKTKVTDLDLVGAGNENVLTLNVSVHYSQLMHVQECACCIKCNLHSLFKRQIDHFLFHVKQVEQTSLVHMLEHNHYIGNLRNHTHQHADVRVSQNALHHNLIVDFLQQRICYVWIEYFLNRHRGPIAEPSVDYGEASLANLLSDLQVSMFDLSDSRNHG